MNIDIDYMICNLDVYFYVNGYNIFEIFNMIYGYNNNINLCVIDIG